MAKFKKYRRPQRRAASQPLPVIEVQIEKLVSGAKGLGFVEGKVCFVQGALVGEIHRVQLTKSKKDFLEGDSIEILQSSPKRVTPHCPHYLKCGGCDFQHISYDDQLQAKESIVLDTLRRMAHWEVESLEIFSSPEWNYRTRARFAMNPSNQLGFRAKQSRDVLAIDNCPVLSEDLNMVLSEPKESLLKKVSSKKELAIQSNGVRSVCRDESIEIVVQGNIFEVSTDVFFQSNLLILPKLVDWVLEKSESSKLNCAVDLFSGVGFFAKFLAEKFTKVIAVERNPQCLELAQRNCPENVDFYTGAAEDWVQDAKVPTIDFLIVDPPREGVDDKVLETIHEWMPKSWVYVSCNPVTLARDLKRINERDKYQVMEMKGFDFYPQTSHLEMAIYFQLR